MKLLFLYGPPATGKLTVARDLAEQTGFKLFDNHVSINAVLPFFAFGTPSFNKIVGTFRKQVVEEAARTGLDLIFTLVYAKTVDGEHVAELTRLVEDNGGEVLFVRLWCSEEELKQRIQAPARAPQHKLTSANALEDLLENYDLFSDVPGRESLVIDNTRLAPEAVAEQVIQHFGLSKKG